MRSLLKIAMRNITKTLLILLIAVVAMFSMQSFGSTEVPAAEGAEAVAAVVKSPLCGTIWSLAPAIFAIVLALIFKEVYSALFAGVVLGACFVTQFAPLETVDFVVN